MRVIIEISNFAIDIAPGNVPPVAPAPPWLARVTPRSSHAEKNRSHTGLVYGCMYGFGYGKFSPFKPADRAHSSSASEASMSQSGRCMRPMCRSGSIGAHIGEPLVVDVLARPQQVEVLFHAAAPHEQRVALERDRFAVLAVVEHDLGGDSVGIEVAQPRVHVVVAGGLEVRHPDTPVGTGSDVAERDLLLLGRRRLALRLERARVGIELTDQLLRAVGPQVLDQARADVRVARHDDDRGGLPVGGVLGRGDGHGTAPRSRTHSRSAPTLRGASVTLGGSRTR